MNSDTRKAGQRFKEDDSPATQEAASAVSKAVDDTLGATQKYQSGNRGDTGRAKVETPMTERVLSGVDKPDNSLEANLARTNAHFDNHMRNAQQFRNHSHIAQRSIDNADKNRYTNTEALDRRVNEREMYSKAQATVKESEIYGDMWKTPYIDKDRNEPAQWQSAKPAKDIETPNWEEMYEKYTDFD